MKKLKEEILEEFNQLSTPSPKDRSTPSTSSSTGNSTPSTLSHHARPNDTYVYGVGILAVLATGVCVFFAYNTFQPKNKKIINKKKVNHQNDVICFRKNIQ